VSFDEEALDALIEQSDDLQSDAMRATVEPLTELTELGVEKRARATVDPDEVLEFRSRRGEILRDLPFGKGALAAVGFGAAVLALMEAPAFADQGADVQMLQTAASIENLAIATYGVALTLPFIGGATANGVVKAFVTKTRAQHQDHVAAFNAAVTHLGGKAQTKPDPVLLGVVNKAKPGLTGPAAVVALAIELETGAAQTYVANTAAEGDTNARKVFASVMGVEAQHVAVLLAVQALLAGGATDLIALPPDASKLPDAAGSVGFPDSFFMTDQARPATEGAVT
jgi:Ferritin-like domain